MYCTGGYVDSWRGSGSLVSATTSPLTLTVTCFPVGSTVMGWDAVGSSTGRLAITILLTPVVNTNVYSSTCAAPPLFLPVPRNLHAGTYRRLVGPPVHAGPNDDRRKGAMC